MDKLLLRPSEVMEMLGLSRAFVYQLIAAGEIPSLKIGSAVRVPFDGLKQWIAGLPVNGPEPPVPANEPAGSPAASPEAK